jgi:hypothetical protein
MTGAALCAELTAVCILIGVTGITIRWHAFVHPVAVTANTGGVEVTARQREGGFVMIEVHIFPTAGHMAGGAIGAELSIMFVSIRVAGITVLGCPFENIVDMA